MIGADEAARVSRAGLDQKRAAMAAGVEECGWGTLLRPNDERRLSAHMRREEIARLRNDRLMTQEEPATLEDVAIFGLENFRVVVDRAIDPKEALLRAIFDQCGIACAARHDRPPESELCLDRRIADERGRSQVMSKEHQGFNPARHASGFLDSVFRIETTYISCSFIP